MQGTSKNSYGRFAVVWGLWFALVTGLIEAAVLALAPVPITGSNLVS